MTLVSFLSTKHSQMMSSKKTTFLFCLLCPLVCVNAGCCYEMGYGTMMKPCCWQNIRDVQNKEECHPVRRIGGSTVYDERSCWGDFDGDQEQAQISLNTLDNTSTFMVSRSKTHERQLHQ